MAMRNRKFSNYFINPKFQWAYIRSMLGLAVLVLAIVYGANFYFFSLFVQKGKDLGLADDHVFFKFLDAQKSTMGDIFLITAVVVALLIVIQGVRYSHKIAGPLYRLHQDMKAMAGSGDVREIHFRKGDDFQELCDSFNALMTKMRNK